MKWPTKRQVLGYGAIIFGFSAFVVLLVLLARCSHPTNTGVVLTPAAQMAPAPKPVEPDVPVWSAKGEIILPRSHRFVSFQDGGGMHGAPQLVTEVRGHTVIVWCQCNNSRVVPGVPWTKLVTIDIPPLPMGAL